MNKNELIARCGELQIEVPEGATNKELEVLIRVAEHPLLVKDLEHHKEVSKTTKEALDATAEELTICKEALVKADEKIEELTNELEIDKTLSTEEKTAPKKDVPKPFKYKHIFEKDGIAYGFNKRAPKQLRVAGNVKKLSEIVKDKDTMLELIHGNSAFIDQIN